MGDGREIVYEVDVYGYPDSHIETLDTATGIARRLDLPKPGGLQALITVNPAERQVTVLAYRGRVRWVMWYSLATRKVTRMTKLSTGRTNKPDPSVAIEHLSRGRSAIHIDDHVYMVDGTSVERLDDQPRRR
jgi:hypothetical protein